ncbi:uncharacterized protein LTR77_004068 [Saxophila tyrrhenica]|uniref:PCI domain-containing protein n=1 Tax=Saxophila tyrrhenica TaxID=1690608 RepID=A0AAV9PBY8_9PEZI|nr:hypothetical protein LTR77_004068 [Saxophila tyrrhenica]
MDQSLALNSLAPFLALAKSATSPRAAADLIAQATSAPNTYVFAELLQQKNIEALQGNEQYGSHHELLQCFAWGTWEQYNATPGLPELSDAQATKLRLLTLLTIASQPKTTTTNLTYSSLCTQLSLASPIDLEHLITQAIYSNLLQGTLNPAAQTVVITSVSPLRDLAPGSVAGMISELEAWSSRCDGVLGELEAEIAKVKAEAVKRDKAEKKMEKQVKAVTDAAEKTDRRGGGGAGTRTAKKAEAEDDGDEDWDGMDVDPGTGGGGGKKKGGGGFGGLMGKLSAKGGGR